MSYLPIHFTEKELACRHCGKSGATDALKQALDDYRDIVRLPVVIHDAYRCPIHDAAVSLVKKGKHPQGIAADFDVPGLSLQEMYDAAKKVPAFYYGGIGVYDKKFIHADVREDGPARWAFVGEKEVSASALVTE